MSDDEFKRLPMLLRAKTVMQLLGVDRRSLEQIRSSNPELGVTIPGLKEVRYRKAGLAKLLKVGV